LSRIVLKIESMIRQELAGLPMEETTRLLLKIHQKLEEIRISVEESGGFLFAATPEVEARRENESESGLLIESESNSSAININRVKEEAVIFEEEEVDYELDEDEEDYDDDDDDDDDDEEEDGEELFEEKTNLLYFLDENNKSIPPSQLQNCMMQGGSPLYPGVGFLVESEDGDQLQFPDSLLDPDQLFRRVNLQVQGGQETLFECRICEKVYRSLNGVKHHLASQHESEGQPGPTLHCPESGCSYTTTKQTLLRVHLNSHANNAPMTCPICDKDYLGGTKAMKQHMKIHQEKKNYTCAECNKQFINLSRLNYHIQNVHSEPTFHCDQCSKMFRSKVNFSRHMRIHSNEKPFQCPHCAFVSNNSANLTSHVRSVHKQPEFTTGQEEKAKKKSILVKNILENKTSSSIRNLLGSSGEPGTVPERLGKNLLKEMTDRGEIGSMVVDKPMEVEPKPVKEETKLVPQTLLKPVSFLKSANREKIITVKNSEGLLVNAVVKVKKEKANGDQVLHVCVKE